jgi:hypothetical protein
MSSWNDLFEIKHSLRRAQSNRACVEKDASSMTCVWKFLKTKKRNILAQPQAGNVALQI